MTKTTPRRRGEALVAYLIISLFTAVGLTWLTQRLEQRLLMHQRAVQRNIANWQPPTATVHQLNQGRSYATVQP